MIFSHISQISTCMNFGLNFSAYNLSNISKIYADETKLLHVVNGSEAKYFATPNSLQDDIDGKLDEH